MRTDPIAIDRQVVAEHERCTANDRNEAGAQPEQRGLSRAIRTPQQHDLTGLDAHRGAGQRGKLAESGHDIVEVDHGVGVCGHESTLLGWSACLRKQSVTRARSDEHPH